MSLLALVGCAALADTDPLDPLALRTQGPDGLTRVLEARAEFDSDEEWKAAVDEVAAQRGAWRSQLYWHTDLDEALARAEAEDKKVLSLRMLGELTEEHSCANSRLFRTVLYTHPGVREELGENWVLHWSSERPAPKVEIDMGDGRVLTRTITGNSIHYALDAKGRPIDALPGLWTPDAFTAALVGARSGEPVDSPAPELTEKALSADQPVVTLAEVPMQLTVGKMMIEQPMLEGMGFRAPAPNPVDDGEWQAAAQPFTLHDQARAVLAEENPGADIDAMAARLAADVALDSIRNEAWLRPRIRAAMGEHEDLESLNRWVYDSVFLTRADDPWLGLVDDTVYTGLDGGGFRG